MKRLAFIASLFGLRSIAQTRPKKFYITGIYHTKEFNDCTVPVIEVYANDRLSALTQTGLTVWTEEEYKSAQLGTDFGRVCGGKIPPAMIPAKQYPSGAVCFGAGCLKENTPKGK